MIKFLVGLLVGITMTLVSEISWAMRELKQYE